jgi:hypothetical protein
MTKMMIMKMKIIHKQRKDTKTFTEKGTETKYRSL